MRDYYEDPRFREIVKRSALARSRALSRLSKRYPHLYRKLFLEAKEEVYREKGPIPR